MRPSAARPSASFAPPGLSPGLRLSPGISPQLSAGRACLPVLDVRLPDLSGLDLQRELASASVQIPIVFMTGHGDIPCLYKR